MLSRTFLTLVLIGSISAACTSAQASALGATCDDFGRAPGIRQSVEIPVGGETTIVLCSNPSTGFGWTAPSVVDAGVLGLVDSSYAAPAAASLPIVGAAGGQVLRIRGLAAGRTTLSTSYDRSWAGGEKGQWTYALDVTVR
jgi:predicted secreted protein